MVNPASFITEMLHNLGRAMSSLAGLAQATHQEAQGARIAAERGSGGGQGGAFDVLSGLPTGSNNARSIASMLAGRGAPAMPRTRGPSSAVIPISESDLSGQGGETLPHMMGRMVGGIFRKITGGGGTATAAGAAVGGAGQTGMAGGLLMRGAGMAGLTSPMTAPLTIGLALYGVSKALQGFGERINEQSRGLRAYSGGMNVAFAGLDRQKSIIQMEYATGTASSLGRATEAEAKAKSSWLPFMIQMGNLWNTVGAAASNASGWIARNTFAHPLFNAKTPEQEAEAAKDKGGSTAWGGIVKRMLGTPWQKGANPTAAPAAMPNLAIPGGIPSFGQLGQQMGPRMFGAQGRGAAAFEPDKLAAAVGVALMKAAPSTPETSAQQRRKLSAQQRRKLWEAAHPGRAAVEAHVLDRGRQTTQKSERERDWQKGATKERHDEIMRNNDHKVEEQRTYHDRKMYENLTRLEDAAGASNLPRLLAPGEGM
jgi:hypothetical protein